jgi:hypothetical protein
VVEPDGLQSGQTVATASVAEEEIGNWSLTSLQQRLQNHARFYWLPLAEGYLTRRPFGSMLRMIAALPLRAG